MPRCEQDAGCGKRTRLVRRQGGHLPAKPVPWSAEMLRYDDGVHDLGGPAPPSELEAAERRCGFSLPPSFVEFLRAHDGGTLFHEAYGIRPCRGLTSVAFGWEGEATVGFDSRRATEDGEMPVVRIEAEAGLFTVGSRFDRWLMAVLAREELVYETDGEFRNVFEEGTPELRADVWRKREERGLRADPDAPTAHFELGRMHAREGRPARAVECIERAIALEPDFLWAHFELGRLQRELRRPAEAVESFLRAARLDPDQAPVAYAWAARIAAERQDVDSARHLRARVRLADPTFAGRHKKLGRALIEAGDPNAADILALGQAIEPDAESAALLERLILKNRR